MKCLLVLVTRGFNPEKSPPSEGWLQGSRGGSLGLHDDPPWRLPALAPPWRDSPRFAQRRLLYLSEPATPPKS